MLFDALPIACAPRGDRSDRFNGCNGFNDDGCCALREPRRLIDWRFVERPTLRALLRTADCRNEVAPLRGCSAAAVATFSFAFFSLEERKSPINATKLAVNSTTPIMTPIVVSVALLLVDLLLSFRKFKAAVLVESVVGELAGDGGSGREGNCGARVGV